MSAKQLVPNTLRVACMADDFRIVREPSELLDCLGAADAKDVPVAIVGDGSNLVLRARLPGLALRPCFRSFDVQRLEADRYRVTVGAGESWHETVRATLGRGIRGLENLVLIPGAVGAAPVQNIGAYGRELSDVLESVQVVDRRRGQIETLRASACGLRYRGSVFKEDPNYVIVAVTLLLGGIATPTDYPDVQRELARMGVRHRAANEADRLALALQTAEAVARVRRRKLPDPRRIGNVGSFFKNPWLTSSQLDALRGQLDVDAFRQGARFKVPAAHLIDAAGWKGARRGAVQVWPRQPLVLVNHGGASGRQVLDMAERVRDDVAAKYGVALELEPTVLGVD